MSFGGAPVDLVEHARVEGVHAGIGQVGHRSAAASPRTRRPGRSASSSTTPQADGCSASGTPSGSRPAPCPGGRRSSDRRSKSVRLSALQARKNSSPSTHCRLARSVPALPSSSGSKNVRTAGGAVRAARWSTHDVRQVVQVDQDLVDPARSNASSQMSSSGRPSMASMHFGVVSVSGLQPAADSRGEQEGLHAPRLPHDAEGPHPRVRLVQHAVEAVHALEPGGVRRDRVGRRALRLPAERPQRADVGEDVARVAEPVLAGHRCPAGPSRTGA